MKITLWLTAALLLWTAAEGAFAQQENDKRLPANGPKGWGLQKAEIKDPQLPRVLLIGDSILNGYYATVTRALEGKANVDAWINPYHHASPGLLEQLKEVLANGPYALIHFNMGLHGWQKGRIPEGQYEPLTRKLIDTLRENAPGAVLIWASSTPVTAKEKPGELDPEINPVIVEHNRLAARVAREYQIPVNDLYQLMHPHLDLARGDQFHWKPEGSVLQGQAVAACIEKALQGKHGAASGKE